VFPGLLLTIFIFDSSVFVLKIYLFLFCATNSRSHHNIIKKGKDPQPYIHTFSAIVKQLLKWFLFNFFSSTQGHHYLIFQPHQAYATLNICVGCLKFHKNIWMLISHHDLKCVYFYALIVLIWFILGLSFIETRISPACFNLQSTKKYLNKFALMFQGCGHQSSNKTNMIKYIIGVIFEKAMDQCWYHCDQLLQEGSQFFRFECKAAPSKPFPGDTCVALYDKPMQKIVWKNLCFLPFSQKERGFWMECWFFMQSWDATPSRRWEMRALIIQSCTMVLTGEQ